MISLTKRFQELMGVGQKLDRKPTTSDKIDGMTAELLGELRGRKVTLLDKMEIEPKSQQIRKITEIIDKHNEFEHTMAGIVHNQVERQQEQFNRRITERRERSVSRSMNKSIDTGKGGPRVPQVEEKERAFGQNILPSDQKTPKGGPGVQQNVFKNG
jgi:hypothetical protein